MASSSIAPPPTAGGPSSVTAPVTAPETNPRGIPAAPFIEDVQEYVSAHGGADGVEGVMRKFQELISKYTFMETSSTRRLASLKSRIPDLENTLETVLFLRSRRNDALASSQQSSSSQSPPQSLQDSTDSSSSSSSHKIETTFELHDTLYARAVVDPAKCEDVYIWLGANVMLSYPIDDAVDLLTDKRDVAVNNIGTCEEDLDFLREQITTLEVAIARVYNWDVVRRRHQTKDKAAA